MNKRREDEASAREDAAIIRSNVEDIAKKGVEIGVALNRQKERMGHGLFMAWVRDECHLGEYAATTMMRAAKEAEANSWLTKNTALISVEAINRLFSKSVPSDVRDQVEALLVGGQKVTVPD